MISLFAALFLLMIIFGIASFAFGTIAGLCSFLIALPFKLAGLLIRVLWACRWGIAAVCVCALILSMI